MVLKYSRVPGHEEHAAPFIQAVEGKNRFLHRRRGKERRRKKLKGFNKSGRRKDNKPLIHDVSQSKIQNLY